jgi:hypothetical protein
MVNPVAELSRLTEPRKSLASPPPPPPTPPCIILDMTLLDMTHHFLVQLWHAPLYKHLLSISQYLKPTQFR